MKIIPSKVFTSSEVVTLADRLKASFDAMTEEELKAYFDSVDKELQEMSITPDNSPTVGEYKDALINKNQKNTSKMLKSLEECYKAVI